MPLDIKGVTLPGETMLEIKDEDLDFQKAHDAAFARVKTYDSDPMLLAWFDRKAGRESPSVSCEGEETDPGWVSYAKSHGGNLTVNVNHGDYIFIYKSRHEFRPK